MKQILQWFRTPTAAGRRAGQTGLSPFDLDTPLCYFGSDPRDVLTIRHAAEGIQVFGSSGSGKSSGSGQHLAMALLHSGAGGVVFTVKQDEPKIWQRYCELAGRLNDLIVFSPAHPWRFNPL